MSLSAKATQYDQMIYGLISRIVFGHQECDRALEPSDLIQRFRPQVMYALRRFQEGKGRSEASFVYNHLQRRFYDLRHQLLTRHGINGADRIPDDSSIGSRSPEDALISSIDLGNAYRGMTEHEQTVFTEYLVEGRTTNEIYQRHPEIGAHRVKRIARWLRELGVDLSPNGGCK